MLNRTTFFIREHVGLLKLKDAYDILDPETKAQIGIAKETTPGWAIALGLFLNKLMLPKVVTIRERDGGPTVFEIRRGFTLLRSKVFVHDGSGKAVGYFRSKLFSFGGGFHIFDLGNRKVAEVKGDWKGWNFRFLDETGKELGTVTKKWAGLGKELFTSADNYMVSLNSVQPNPGQATLLLAAGLAIDIVYKEKA